MAFKRRSGMNGTEWKNLVPISEQVKLDLTEVIKRDFISMNRSRISEGSKRDDVINGYLKFAFFNKMRIYALKSDFIRLCKDFLIRLS